MAKTMLNNIIKKCYFPIREKFRDTNKINGFKKQLRASDVFIVGHPKSGNTWLSRMVASLIEDRFNGNINLANINDFIPTFHSHDDRISLYSNNPDPRIFRNETPLYPDLYPKTIYIVRDPRAVYVSYYHHCIHDTQHKNWSINDFIEEMLTHGCIKSLEPDLIRWDRHVSQWLERSKKQPVKFVKYEDMHKNRQKVMAEIATFIGIPYDEETISSALEKGSFQNMRREEVTFGAAPYSGDKGEKGYFVRKGKVDGWKEELPEDLSTKIEEKFSGVMTTLGYR